MLDLCHGLSVLQRYLGKYIYTQCLFVLTCALLYIEYTQIDTQVQEHPVTYHENTERTHTLFSCDIHILSASFLCVIQHFAISVYLEFGLGRIRIVRYIYFIINVLSSHLSFGFILKRECMLLLNITIYMVHITYMCSLVYLHIAYIKSCPWGLIFTLVSSRRHCKQIKYMQVCA